MSSTAVAVSDCLQYFHLVSDKVAYQTCVTQSGVSIQQMQPWPAAELGYSTAHL